MKFSLPDNHSLSAKVTSTKELFPVFDGNPSVTDVQYEALEAGIARGESVLVSAPTSTGKTLIGWWAIASALDKGKQAVYLVSHRALAQQKFEEAQSIFLANFLDGDRSSIICATGDGVEDCAGLKSNAPLSAKLLVATYEKFLGSLSVGGAPSDLSNVCFVCDELQLVGDEHRGQSTELLLTLMRRAGWDQFVALSAVLGEKDAKSLADWLNLKLVRNPSREKSIRLECRTGSNAHTVSYGRTYEGDLQSHKASKPTRTNDIIKELLAQNDRSPVIVFCMKVDETYDLARSWALGQADRAITPEPPIEDIDDELARLVSKRTAFHNAELTEEERRYVEDNIEQGSVDVVFATTTLAAGVNFPLGSAIFSSWERYNRKTRGKDPINAAEFQNMAGRVGRMGQDADEGLVILTAMEGQSLTKALKLMDFSQSSRLGSGIKTHDFGALTLQIFAGNLCRSREDAFELLSSTLTASRELDINRAGISHWRDELNVEIDALLTNGCLFEANSSVTVTPFGLAVARSGLKPATATYFLQGLASLANKLSEKLNDPTDGAEDDLLFILAHAALRCPEFTEVAGKPSRLISWKIAQNGAVTNPYAQRLSDSLFGGPWIVDAKAANGALVLVKFAGGTVRQELEKVLADVRLGTIQSTAREVSWVLAGIADIIQSITAPHLADESRPAQLRGAKDVVEQVRQLSRPIRRHSVRINTGLPSEVVWMTQLNLEGPKRKLNRKQILALKEKGLTRAIDLMDGSPANDGRRREALSTNSLANLVRKASYEWKKNERDHRKALHLRRASTLEMQQVILGLYELRGDDLEAALEAALNTLAINFSRLDQKDRQAHPDYLLSIENFEPIILEVKSKRSDNDLVSLNGAMEVLGASELAGYRDNFCITLCSPGVEPSVPATIERCKRLAVIEIADLVEALLRLNEGSLTRSGLYNWLTTPGIALSETLPRN